MPKHLPAPEGTPDDQAQQIIEQFAAYLAGDRDPVVTATGLRHIYHQAALAWEESLRQARRRGKTWREIREPTGDGLSTIQDRASGRSPRRRAEKEGRR